MLLAAAGIFVGNLQDALHFRAGVIVGVVGLVVVLIFFTEIHAAGELANAHEVGSVDELILQRTLVKQALEGLHGTDVGKQSELLAHGKQSLLGTHLGRWVVVELGVADRCKEHGIGLLADIVGLLGEGIAHLVDGMRTADGFRVTHFMTELLGNSRHHGHALFHNLRADTIASQHSNFQIHNVFVLNFLFGKITKLFLTCPPFANSFSNK